MLASFHSVDHYFTMPMVRRANDYHIDILIIRDLVEIAVVVNILLRYPVLFLPLRDLRRRADVQPLRRRGRHALRNDVQRQALDADVVSTRTN